LTLDATVTDVADEANLHPFTTHSVDASHSGGTGLSHVLDDTCRRQFHVVEEDVVLPDFKLRHGISLVTRQHLVNHHKWLSLWNERCDGELL
jgi:hypothetical protein